MWVSEGLPQSATTAQVRILRAETLIIQGIFRAGKGTGGQHVNARVVSERVVGDVPRRHIRRCGLSEAGERLPA